MPNYSLEHFSDAELLGQLSMLVARDRLNTATILAHIAEVDARRLYLPAGCSSMHAFCVEKLGFSDEVAFKRIRAARAARRFPALFAALSEGRLHLEAIALIATHLTFENARMLIEAATHKRSKEIEEWLAVRFPVTEPKIVHAVRVISPPSPPHIDDSQPQLLIERGQNVESYQQEEDERYAAPDSCERTNELSAPTAPDSEVPAAPRFHFQFVVPKSTHDKLCHAQTLLSHSVPAGDLAQVFDRALDALISQLEVRRLGVSTREFSRRGGSDSGTVSRYIPAAVRRAVWVRDEGRCTFVSITGGRCRCRRYIQLDHLVPFARGGKATVENLRLRCSSHNQYEAERVFGVDFMKRKRQEAREAAAAELDHGHDQ